MKNHELAGLFERTADVMAIQGENTFRVNAYRKIARTLEELSDDAEALAKSGNLADLPGIGEHTVERIQEYLRSGKIAEFEALWQEVPAGVMEMLKIPTLGAKTAALLWHEGGVTSVEQLLQKIEAPDRGGLTKIAGIGEKKLDKIKQNLAFLATTSGRVRLAEALPIAQEMVALLKNLPMVQEAQYCGSLRRGKETIGDIDIAILAEEKHGPAISAAVTGHPLVGAVLAQGATKTSIRTTAGLQVDIRIVPAESFGAAVQYFTGSKEHNVRIRELAIKKGLKLNEWGLFKGEKQVAGRTEEEIYAGLDMACLPAEMRENRGEVELALDLSQGKVTSVEGQKVEVDGDGRWRALELGDIRGDLHTHTTASDGARSIEEMVAEAKRRGWQYLAITDHSKSQFQANGLKSDRMVEHLQAIRAVAKEAKGIFVLAGAEVDILADGSLDYEDDLLAQMDFVIASPHAALTQEPEPATQRLMRAMANPHVHCIGHPTGRMIPARRGLEPDMKKVVYAAARNGVALELNANSFRLDLRDSHLRLAREAGVPICINTDAHSFEDFDEMIHGILTARRGWVQRGQVLNARPVEGLKKWLKERKGQSAWNGP